MMSIPFLLTRGFAALVRLYPLRFRQEFGEEMETVFSDQVEDLSARGSLGLIGMFLRELPHVALNLARQHWANLNGRRGPDGLRGWSPSRLVWSSCLAFGLTAGLATVFSSIIGLSTLQFSLYTPPIILASFLLSIFFNALPMMLLWQALPERKSKFGYWIPAVGVGLVNVLMLMETIQFMPNPPLIDKATWWYWSFGNPLLGNVLRGVAFGGLFAWVTQGRRSILPLALVSGVGRFLGSVLTEGSILLTYQIFLLNPEWDILLTQNPWFYLWSLVLVILGGMVFGALLGWQISLQEKRKLIGLHA